MMARWTCNLNPVNAGYSSTIFPTAFIASYHPKCPSALASLPILPVTIYCCCCC